MLPSLHSSQPTLLFYPGRYEDEINRRTGAENEFVVLKKVTGLGITGQKRELTHLAEFKQDLVGVGVLHPLGWVKLGDQHILGWVLPRPGMGTTFSVQTELPCFLVSCGSAQLSLWSHPCESELCLLPKNLVLAHSQCPTLHLKNTLITRT